MDQQSACIATIGMLLGRYEQAVHVDGGEGVSGGAGDKGIEAGIALSGTAERGAVYQDWQAQGRLSGMLATAAVLA